MSTLVNIGHVAWSREDLIARLPEFSSLYAERPIEDNTGGMRSPHLFLMWFALQALKPKAVVESGVWLGQGTWFIEKACPDAQLYCIDPVLSRVRYRSRRATYLDLDFSVLDWRHLPRDETILFFDDHQNAYERVKTAKWFGFRHLIFEDNYPPLQGDCYSLKKAFAHAGFRRNRQASQSHAARLKRRLGVALGFTVRSDGEIPPNEADAKYLRENVGIYHEFPPVFKTEHTRWGDPWTEDNYPTPEPLFRSLEHAYQRRYLDEAIYYTWMCYVRLK